MKPMLAQAQAAGQATGFPAELQAFDPLPPPLGMEAPPPIRPQKELPAQELINALQAMGERSKTTLRHWHRLIPGRFPCHIRCSAHHLASASGGRFIPFTTPCNTSRQKPPVAGNAANA